MTDRPGTIRSERLELEPLTVADADEMVAVLGDPRLYEFIGGEPPTLDDVRDRYRALTAGHSPDGREEWRNWTVRTRADGRAIGTVQATILDGGREAMIAWLIGVPWQGRGFATEAVSALIRWLEGRGVSSISANIRPDHGASAAVASRVGLEPTAQVVDGERVWRATTDESR